MNLEKIADKVLEYSFYLLFFLVPLVMTPWNFELFEYNKMMLIYAATTVIVGAWTGKMILAKRFIFRRTPFDIPLLLFLASQFFSFLVSIDHYTSLWGYYSRFHGGLFSTISYLLLYWAFVSNFDKQKVLSAIRYLLFAATLVASYGILEHFGIDAKYWVQDVKNRVFSTLGQPNWLAAYLLAIIPLPIAFIPSFKFKRKELQSLMSDWRFLLYGFLFLLFMLCLFFTKSRSGFLAAVPSLGFFLFLLILVNISSFKKQLRQSLLILFVILAFGGAIWGGRFLLANRGDIAYIFGLSNQVNITPQQPFGIGSTSADIRKIVWRGAIDIARHYPLFGSGVETFGYAYYQFRPVQHNLLSEWDFLYNKAHNEYFNFLATTGLVGLGSYLLLIGWVIWWNLKMIRDTQNVTRKEHNEHVTYHMSHITLITALFAGWASILVTNFFGFSVVPVALFFFLFPAFTAVLTREEKPPQAVAKKPTVSGFQYAAIAATAFLVFYFLLKLISHWQADTEYATGVSLDRQGEYLLAYNRLQEAIKRNPSPPVYQDELSWSAANLAFLFSLQKDEANTNNFLQLAIASSDKALAISPRNLNFYKTRAKIYFRLAQIDLNFLGQAREILLKAHQLAPTDAKIVYNLALVYQALGQKEEAVKTFEEAVKIKNNYFEARLALIGLYKQAGQMEKALEHYRVIYPQETNPLKKINEWKVQ